MVGDNEIPTEYLNHRFSPRDSNFWDRKIDTYRATDAGKCLRQIYCEFDSGRRERPEAFPHFHLGHLIENYIERALTHHHGADNIKNSFGIEPDFGGFKMVGRTNPVPLGANATSVRLFEVKSTKRVKFREDEPSRHCVHRVRPYMRALNLDCCTIIHVQKSDLKAIFYNIPHEEPTFQRRIGRIEELHRALNRNEIPKPTFFEGWECRFCSYKKECPRGDLEWVRMKKDCSQTRTR